ncbi:MAG: tetratricopeptide repeat protein, partial [Terriglobia bacterium]
LLHTGRFEDAEKYLKQCLQSNPNLAPALASMGVLRLRQKQWSEARDYFQKAVAADSGSYLVHYHYANLLLRDESEGGSPRLVSSSERFRTVQSEVKRAIELAPWFVESYRLLAYAANMTGEELPATVELLKKAQAYAPGRQDLRLDLARLYARMEDYTTARQLIEPITRQSSEPQIQQEVETFLAQLQSFEEQRRLIASAQQQSVTLREPVAEEVEPTTEVSEAPVMKRKKASSGPSPESPSAPVLQVHPPKGERVAGTLARIECADNGVIFVVRSGAKTFKLHTDDPEKLLLYKENGESLGTISMSCGPLSPPSPVVVTYRKSATPSASHDGILLSVLFVNR